MFVKIISKKQVFVVDIHVPVDRYPYHWYTILLGPTHALAHISVYFTHHVFDLSPPSFSTLVGDELKSHLFLVHFSD